MIQRVWAGFYYRSISFSLLTPLSLLAKTYLDWCGCVQEELVAAVREVGFEANIVTDSRSDLVMLQVHLSLFMNLFDK